MYGTFPHVGGRFWGKGVLTVMILEAVKPDVVTWQRVRTETCGAGHCVEAEGGVAAGRDWVS